jgi:hypothetical protein
MNTSESNKTGKLGVLKTSTLIRRFREQCPVTEIYDKAVRCYDTLIDSVEKPDISKEISALLNIPAVKVKEYAESVINILLFNKENDPYLSFGLERTASFSEVHKRWKRLIVLYHPDRYQNQKIFEERVKKINEIYEEIRTVQNQDIFRKSFNPVNGIRMPQNSRLFDYKYFKHIPSLIIALAVIIAFFSLVFFIFDLISSHPSASSHKLKEKEIKMIRIEIENVNNQRQRPRGTIVIK